MDEGSQSNPEVRLVMNDEEIKESSPVTVTVGRLSSAEEDNAANGGTQILQQQQPGQQQQQPMYNDQQQHPRAPLPLEPHPEDEAKETTGLLMKTSRSSSVLVTGSGHQRPLPIKRSASSYLKRGSLPVDQDLDLADARRSLISRQVKNSYGTLYPPLYHKLSLLHRLSFADIVERITLTWENVNVYAPAAKRKMFWKSNSTDIQLQPKHILKNGWSVILPLLQSLTSQPGYLSFLPPAILPFLFMPIISYRITCKSE